MIGNAPIDTQCLVREHEVKSSRSNKPTAGGNSSDPSWLDLGFTPAAVRFAGGSEMRCVGSGGDARPFLISAS